MTYRLRNIAIAIALAVLAAMLTSFYVRQEKQTLQEGQALETVFVATADLPVGASGDEVASNMKEQEVAKTNLSPGAIVSPQQVQGKVVTERIYAGEQVSELRFRAPTEQGIRAKLTGNLRAVQVAADPNQVLSGTLRDGDFVDIVGNWKVPETGQGVHYSRTILRNIEVLKAPHALADDKLTSGDKSKTVTLALTDAQAQKFFWLTTNGDWALELRPSQDPADSPEGAESALSVLADGLPADQVERITRSLKERTVR